MKVRRGAPSPTDKLPGEPVEKAAASNRAVDAEVGTKVDEPSMEFQILGPVQAWAAGDPVDLGTRMQRLILAVLLLEVNQLVPIEWLVDMLWRDRPPPSARRIVQAHLSRLRTTLSRRGADRWRVSLVRRGPGYLLACDPGSIDAHQFRMLLERARNCEDDAAKTLTLRQALALWQGPALADVASADLRDKLCHGLQEARLTALEERFEAELRLGHHLRLIDELTEVVARYPYWQHFAGQLMRALHGVERSADALAVYQHTRQRLSDDLGLDTSSELKQLQVAILRADPGLDPMRQVVRHPPIVALVPAQLPPDIPDFTGRAASLAQLDTLLDGWAEPHTGPAAAPVAVITGKAGAGKTALAIHWAHHRADRFTGQLYVNLRGYSPRPPMDPMEALTALLGGLGIAPERIPRTVEGATALYRSLLGQRRVVVVLDDAGSTDQVRPLLPGNPACLALVTSRERLVGLVVREAARQIPLGSLGEDESLALLRRLLGTDRVGTEQPAARRLAELCDHLPLALRIAAARLVDEQHASVAEYVAELSVGDPLIQLEIDGDESHGVGAAFALSYVTLPAPAQRVFRLLSVAPGTELPIGAIAALAGTDQASVRHPLRRLVNANLVEQRGSDRFTVHTLLRHFGAQRLAADDPDEPQRATERLLRWYHVRTDAAARLLYPRTRRQFPPAPGSEAVFGDDPQRAQEWLEAEGSNLVVLVLAATAEPAMAPSPVVAPAGTN